MLGCVRLVYVLNLIEFPKKLLKLMFIILPQYQLLMTEAILAFYSENVWSQQYTRPVKKTLHWILQTVGSLVALIGMIIEFANKQRHFTTTHAILGLIAGIFTLLGMLNGVTALFSIELNKYVKPIYLKMAHNVNGIAAFVLGKNQFRMFKLEQQDRFDSRYYFRNDSPSFWI